MGHQKLTTCNRCNVRLQIATERVEDARPIRKSLTARGYCPNCAITELIKGTEPLCDLVSDKPPLRGPPHAGMGHFPEAFRLPHIQEQFERVLRAGNCEAVGQIDWDEVIANWELPFPRKIRGYG